MRIIALRLEGMLQSWGEDSKWDERSTSSVPTKSGIVGLIAACLGIDRDDPFIIHISQIIKIAVRVDRKGTLLSDFHTVASNKMIVASGGKQSRTIVSHRQYLQDASFVVLITSADQQLMDSIAKAVNDPKWIPYLGRKSCAPSKPIFVFDTTRYISFMDCFCNVPLSDRTDDNEQSFLIEEEDDCGNKYRRDEIIDNRERRFFLRNVKTYTLARSDINVQVNS